jgi:hypothetical protein
MSLEKTCTKAKPIHGLAFVGISHHNPRDILLDLTPVVNMTPKFFVPGGDKNDTSSSTSNISSGEESCSTSSCSNNLFRYRSKE